jgi:hypothetical protein
MLFLGGVLVSAGTASRLVLLLLEGGEDGLATRIGMAVDHLRPRVRLGHRDRRAIARILDGNCPDEFLDLRAAVGSAGRMPSAS